MNLSIKPLTPELAADYFDFFENRAFTDNSPYAKKRRRRIIGKILLGGADAAERKIRRIDAKM